MYFKTKQQLKYHFMVLYYFGSLLIILLNLVRSRKNGTKIKFDDKIEIFNRTDC